MRLAIIISVLTLTSQAKAQWDIEDSHTTASLRGIDSVGDGVAWASGTNGTILRTEDGGFVWQLCAIPPGAQKLDFRGIQAFDANTAIVMSSGKGDLSRLYKTTDGCQTWKLLFTNPDKEGFWDAFQMNDRQNGWLAGDPINKKFVMEQTYDGAANFTGFQRSAAPEPRTNASEGIPANDRSAFAASNSSLAFRPFVRPQNSCQYSLAWFGTSGPGGPMIYRLQRDLEGCTDVGIQTWIGVLVPMAGSNSASGIFSLKFKDDLTGVAVGGDFTQPSLSEGTAAYSSDGGKTWRSSPTSPHGYRSAVAYDVQQKLWITVGPNGTDISRDDGRNWTALKPTKEDAADADKNWNALSLPFVVGPNGRIGKLRPSALKP
jgi:photosystem II stability/assembly factor-like uncharacterized protein